MAASKEHAEDKFRPENREMSEDDKSLVGQIKSAAQILIMLYEKLPDARYREHAVKDLESSVLWATKAIAG